MNIKIGPAGTTMAFNLNKENKMINYPKYIASFSLNAFEYQCGNGVRISEQSAKIFGQECKNNKITVSIHAPYYISLSSVESQKRDNSIKYILQTSKVASAMGAKRIVIHSGSCAKMSRLDALNFAVDTLNRSLKVLKDNNLEDIIICPEVMGKTNQLGCVEEVVKLSKLGDNVIPCIDFGHLNARLFGKLKSKEDYNKLFSFIENELGNYKMKNIHIHFSKIEYSVPGGEKRHLTFEDTIYGPEFEPLAEILIQKSCTPIIICESAGTQIEDALTMMYFFLRECTNR